MSRHINHQKLARMIDRELNPPKIHTPATGFVLLTFGFDAPGIANYVSNGTRADIIIAMRECADRLEKKQDNARVAE